MKKKGNILAEYVIFIILNLVFLSIILLFVYSKTGSSAVLEEKYSKQIALILDSAKPVMTMTVNMGDAIGKKEANFPLEDVVKIEGSVVTVKLREKGGYSYSFFNDVEVKGKYFDGDNYVMVVDGYE